MGTPRGFWVFPALLLGFLILYTVHNATWVSHNDDYAAFDVVYHLDEAADLRNLARATWESDQGWLSKVGQTIRLLNNQAGSHLMWPRAVYGVSALWAAVFGGGERAPFHANWVFLALGIAGVVAVMLRLHRSTERLGSAQAWELATMAVVIWLLFPGTYGSLRLYSQYFPLACCLPLVLWLMMRCEGLSRRGWAVALGFAFGLTILVKALVVFYLAVPLVYLAWLLWAREPSGRAGAPRLHRLLNGAIACVPVAILAYLWMYGSIGTVFQELAAHLAPGTIPFPDGHPKPHFESYPAWSVLWLTYYLRVAAANLGLVGLAGLGAAVPLLLWRRHELPWDHRLDRRLLYLAAGGAMVLLTFISSKEVRFEQPMLPLWALVITLALGVLKPWVRRAVFILWIGIAAHTFWMLSWDPVASEARRERLVQVLGEEEGVIWARTPRPAPFPGLVNQILAAVPPAELDDPPRIGYLSLPHGGPRFNDCNEQVRIDAVRLKNRAAYVSHTDNPFLDPAALTRLGGLDIVDMRFLPHDYMQTTGTQLDLLVVFHFYGGYINFEPPYIDQAGEAMPELVFARTFEEFQQQLPGSWVHRQTLHYPTEGNADPAYVYFLERRGE